MRLRLFILLALLFTLLNSRERPWADANVVFQTTASLVERHRLDLEFQGGSPWFYAQHDGRRYGVFPLGNVIAMVPSYLLLRGLSHIPGLSEEALLPWACHLTPALLMAGACVLFFTLALRLGASRRWALWLTLILAFTTIVFIFARSLYSEALQTLVLLWLVELTLAQGERVTAKGMVLLGLAAGLLLNTKLVHAVLLPIPAAYLLIRYRAALRPLLRALPWAILAFIPFAALALWHNYLKTGSIWSAGYEVMSQYNHHPMFGGDLLTGLYGFLFSSGKSIFLYSPPLLLGLMGWPTLWRRFRGPAAFLLAIVGAIVLVNSKFDGWHGDYTWGPRHVVPATPLILLAAAPWIGAAMARGSLWLRRLTLGGLVGLGAFVQFLGAAFYWDHFIRILIAVKDQTGAKGWFEWSLWHGHFFPVFSPLRGHFWLFMHGLRNDADLARDAPWAPFFPGKVDLTDAWLRLRPDWWFLNWTTSPLSCVVGVVILTLLIVAAVVTACSLARRLKTEEV